ncbi:hypothetical protein JMA_03650 [Jeotgalibacillus malaysiensis]|uniref:RNA polymerase sigma factor 70 region 4 type 2 domain-containing protein n=1 Tax=Jeotgalibacillus malaysiensis TaxID=1508404 RepID=A0A0B5ALX3_9BACL|nr:sigma factor-like helix-turn-helix DNA-binding protein [Jeotgalibacillus malaysiensis]AJD89682.1 hypothetical protein JMA_03650 [Jeotgalibacillus malaysiensis]
MRAHLTVVKERQNESVEEVIQKLQAYCRWLTKDKWDGEEIAQEALLKAYRVYPEERWKTALLKKIAYHLWVDQQRTRKTMAAFPAEEGSTESRLHDIEELLDALTKRLTPKQLISFILKEGFQYKISEIADLLNMTEPGIKALLNRARRRLKGMSESDIQSFWEEELYDELFPVLVDAVSMQDPEKLLAMLPAIFTSSAALPKRTAVPSHRLSLAA